MAKVSEYFVEWYKEVNPEASHETLEMRGKGLDAWMEFVIKNAEFKYIVLIPNIILGRVENDQDELNEFIKFFKDHDDFFPVKNNQGELRVLAAEIFSRMLDWDDFDSIDSSMVAMSLAFTRELNQIPQQDVFDLSVKYIKEKSNEMRAASNEYTKNDLKKRFDDLKDIRKKFKENNSITTPEFLGALIESSIAIYEDAENNKNFLVQLNQRNDVLSEELNLLWWLQNGKNADSNDLYADLTVFQSSLLIGKEFSKIITQSPGPVTIKSLMHKQLLKCKEGNDRGGIKKYIESLKVEISKQFIADYSNYNNFVSLLPLHEGIKRFIQSGGEGSGWFKTYCDDFKILDSEDIHAVDIAYQFYIENKIIERLELI